VFWLSLCGQHIHYFVRDIMILQSCSLDYIISCSCQYICTPTSMGFSLHIFLFLSLLCYFRLQHINRTVFLQDDILKFNIRLADLFLLKLKIEAANGQETLKIDRYKYIIHKRLCLYLKVKNLK
jgi:hypothetical protein